MPPAFRTEIAFRSSRITGSGYSADVASSARNWSRYGALLHSRSASSRSDGTLLVGVWAVRFWSFSNALFETSRPSASKRCTRPVAMWMGARASSGIGPSYSHARRSPSDPFP